MLSCEFFHDFHGLTRRITRGRLTIYGEAGELVVAVDHLGTKDGRDVQQVLHRNLFARITGYIQIADIIRAFTEILLSTYFYLIGTSVEVKVVDVLRAQVLIKGGKQGGG